MAQTRKMLHRIVHSMSPKQIQVLKAYCKRSKINSNRLVLFDTLLKQEKYDEQKLIKRLKKRKDSKLADNLPAETTLLFKLVLKIIRMTKDETLIEKQLRNDFEDAVFLHGLGYFDKSKRMRNKVKESGKKHNATNLLLDVYEFEYWIDLFSEENNDLESIEETYKNELELINAKKLEIDLKYTYRKVFRLVQNISALEKDVAKKQLADIENVLNKIDEEQCKSFNTRMLYLHSMAKIYRLKSNREAALKCMKEMYLVYQSQKDTNKASNLQDLKFLANFLNYLVIYDEPYEQFLEILIEIKGIKLKTRYEAMVQFSNVYYIEFVYYLKQGNFEAMENTLPVLEEGLIEYGDEMDLGRKITIWYNLMIQHFLIEDFNASHSWIQKILDYGKNSRRVDFFYNSKIFQVLVHYEIESRKLESTVFLADLNEKVQNSFKTAKKSNKLVNLIAKLIRAYCKKRHLKKEDFEATLEKFYQIDKSENKDLPYDEVEIWLLSKIQKLPMQKIAEQMLQNKTSFRT